MSTASVDANHIDPRVFPAGSRRGRSCQQLKIGGVRASALAEHFGTPLYVLDEAVVRDRARAIREAFERESARIGTEATVYYAGKAFLATAIVSWMDEDGVNLDVASGGELEVALSAGIDPSRIGFHGNNKSVAEIRRAVSAGVGTLIVDSEQEVRRIAAAAEEFGRVQRVRLRVNSGVHASTHDYLATSHEDQKFGVPLGSASEIVRQIADHAGLDFVGLHCHIGSQILGASGFRESAKRLLTLYPELAEIIGRPVPELNLGGGFGIAYTPDEADAVPDIDSIARELTDIVATTCDEAGVPIPRLAFEPGRSIVGPAGVTLYTVGTTKAVPLVDAGADSMDEGFDERLYVSVDGGMSDNLRTALYDAPYHVRIANRVSSAKPALVRVVGKHCESGDIVVDRDVLPGDVAPGDVLAVAATGAYCWSMSSNYNYVPRPPVVAIRDGAARVIVRGETIEELVAKSVRGSDAVEFRESDLVAPAAIEEEKK